MSAMIQYVLYLAILVVLAIPLGAYIKNVMNGEKTFLSKVLTPCENLIYKVMRVDREEQMTWKKYAVSVLTSSGVGLVFLFLLQLVQGVLPGNPQHLSGVKWDLAFNTSASFITNTNWQAYSGESTLSYLTQALGLTVQNFVSAATGIAVLFALIRGFIKVKSSGLGSFWVDLTRIVVHILLPLNLVISLLLVGGGVIQNLKSAETVSLVEPIAVSAEGEILEDAVIDLDTETVTVDGEIVSNAQIVTEQFVPMGPAASQVAIKQTGTNGGGYMGVNSAHPLENPNAFTNLIEMISILLIPAALCFTFGSAVKNKKQGVAIFMAMFLCLVVALGCIAVTEQVGTPQLAQNGAVNMSMAEQAGGNMEGKETRFGIAGSSTWAAFTTAASNGSVNSMHEVVSEALKHINRKSKEHTIRVTSGNDFILAHIDAKLIVQVIINLVDNAIKYTSVGSVIEIHTDQKEQWVTVSVSDNGPGIPDEQKPRIFDMFYSGANKVVDSRRSLGLGLSLCKSIVTAHGGTISVSDNQPNGTVFTFTLPAGKVELHE